ncbi:MAG: GerAB/ArcD/ProY family transporter [Clostridia bacterium]|nr:GerAB/ArcD/ProY family transporter [Clostridia bacterium]
MNKEYAVKSRQISMFFIAFLPVMKFFSMPSVLASFSKNDGWISALIISVSDIITLYFILLLSKKTDKTFFRILEEVLGKAGKKIIILFYAVYFFAKSILPIMEQKNYIEQTLYEVAPSPLFFLPFFFLAFYLSTKKLRIIGRISDIAFFFSVTGIIILFAMTIKNAELDAVFPIARNGGKKIFSGSYHLSVWFNDCIYMLFFLGNYKVEKDGGKKIILSYSVATFLVVIFCLLFYCIFTFIADRQVIALSQLSEYNSVINHSGRFDNVGIVIILFSASFTIAFPIYFCVYCLTEVFGEKYKTLLISIVISIEILIHYFLYAYLKIIKEIIFFAFCPYFILFGNIIPIILSLIYLLKGKKDEVII